jgi:hypothetical protein
MCCLVETISNLGITKAEGPTRTVTPCGRPRENRPNVVSSAVIEHIVIKFVLNLVPWKVCRQYRSAEDEAFKMEVYVFQEDLADNIGSEAMRDNGDVTIAVRANGLQLSLDTVDGTTPRYDWTKKANYVKEVVA